MHNAYSDGEYSFLGGVFMVKDTKNICKLKDGKMERFLEVCLLVLLYDKLGYGYGLIEDLEDFGFSSQDLNVSTLYRTLRKMEKEDLVTSLWEESGLGPKKRVYKITQAGKDDLDNWIDALKIRKSRIENLIRSYEEKVISS